MTVVVAALIALAVLVWPRRPSPLDLGRQPGEPHPRDVGRGGRPLARDRSARVRAAPTHEAARLGAGRPPRGEPPRRSGRPLAAGRWSRHRRRSSQDDDRIVHALDLVAAAVRAGADPQTALDFATAQLGLVGNPLAPSAIVGLALDLPTTLDSVSDLPSDSSGDSAVDSAGDSTGVDVGGGMRAGLRTPGESKRAPPGMQFVARAWSLSDVAGVPLADAIDVGVHLLRADRAARSRVDVALAGPRATIRVLTLLPLAGPLLGAALGVPPTAWVDSPIAVASVISGVALMVIGRWWCARMVAQLGPGSTRPDPLEVAATTDLLALVLRGGCGVVDGLELVSAVSDDDVAADLASVAAAVRWGMPWARAWAAVGPGWSAVGRALVLADSLGVAPSDPLARAAVDQRRDHAHRLEIGTARLGVRIVLPLGLAFLPAFVLLGLVPLVLALAGELWRG